MKILTVAEEEIVVGTTKAVTIQEVLLFSGLVSCRSEMKLVAVARRVMINGNVCVRRWEKVRPGDVITLRPNSPYARTLKVVHADRSSDAS